MSFFRLEVTAVPIAYTTTAAAVAMAVVGGGTAGHRILIPIRNTGTTVRCAACCQLSDSSLPASQRLVEQRRIAHRERQAHIVAVALIL